jgi:hypothetical protein
MQIKTTLRFHLTPVRLAIIKNTTTNKCWQGCTEKESSYTAGGNARYCNHSLKKIWRLITNLNVDLPYDPAILLLGIYPKECDTGYSRGTCKLIFIVVLFTIAKLWKQPRCSTTDVWNKKMCYLYSQVNGWKWRTSFWRLRRPEIIYPPSYVHFRSRANTAM